MGVSYAMGDITLAYEMGSMDDEDASEEIENHKQIAVSYAVASGIKLTLTNSEVDSNDAGTVGDDANDKEMTEVQLTLSF
jgi:predicted porin